ncbi:hypothetical protein L2725_13855 [Shewanella corallii]|uniref:DUF1616 domain-containing protein n=1 Tax=Shewanella corallii TaxID=560080 RepID=A0ABT0N8M9_9GAMM|nr:hypothetical protein [Shewanella corallii]MCL2914848.1 hypothetical protein [Shewanella corallii]
MANESIRLLLIDAFIPSLFFPLLAGIYLLIERKPFARVMVTLLKGYLAYVIILLGCIFITQLALGPGEASNMLILTLRVLVIWCVGIWVFTRDLAIKERPSSSE